MRKSVAAAAVFAAAVLAWIASGQLGGDGGGAVGASGGPERARPAEDFVASVRVRETVAAARGRRLVVTGRTEESRRVELRAETAGPVAEVPAAEGGPVAPGDVVVRIGIQDRKLRLDEAEALVRQREIEHEAASQLASKGFRSSTGLADARAKLDAARTRMQAARLDIAKTVIRAPFAGVLETRAAETGGFLRVGDRVATVVDLDPLLAVGFVSERDVSGLRAGAKGAVRLIDGRTAEGTIRYVASVADPRTRTFRIELEVPNPGDAIRAGMTVEIALPLPAASCHEISPSILALSGDGRIGVRVVDGSDRVAFVPVEPVEEAAGRLCVRGPRDGDRLITVGHEFVAAGQKVRAVPEAPGPAS